jgi:hypothetical protein
MLLDGQGRIDAELYPNLAALAGDGTWYRNHSTVSAWTYEAVPAMLTGQLPAGGPVLPDASKFPGNLFTLLAGTHDIHAEEQITRLCPADVCPRTREGAVVPRLLGDAVDWWRGALDTNVATGAQILPGALEPDRGQEFVDWLDAQDFAAGGRPGLWFHHLVLPHEPWDVLEDLTPYTDRSESIYGLYLYSGWARTGPDVARQRHVLQAQAADRLVGLTLDRLRDAGTYDDALVVVAADHGQAFTPLEPLRGVAEAQYEQVMWSPLIVKAPGQSQGVVDDGNVESIDVLPTMADVLGIELPWSTDGRAAGTRPRDPGDKRIADHSAHRIRPPPGEHMIPVDGRQGFERVLTADAVSGTGPTAVWQRTEHGALVGRDVDELTVGDPAGDALAVEQLDRIRQPRGDPPLLELVGHTDLARDRVVVVAVDGLVAGIAPTTEPLDEGFGDDADYEGSSTVHALLWPAPFRDDGSEVTAYVVEGEPGAETLRPLEVGPA